MAGVRPDKQKVPYGTAFTLTTIWKVIKALPDFLSLLSVLCVGTVRLMKEIKIFVYFIASLSQKFLPFRHVLAFPPSVLNLGLDSKTSWDTTYAKFGFIHLFKGESLA